MNRFADQKLGFMRYPDHPGILPSAPLRRRRAEASRARVAGDHRLAPCRQQMNGGSAAQHSALIFPETARGVSRLPAARPLQIGIALSQPVRGFQKGSRHFEHFHFAPRPPAVAAPDNERHAVQHVARRI